MKLRIDGRNQDGTTLQHHGTSRCANVERALANCERQPDVSHDPFGLVRRARPGSAAQAEHLSISGWRLVRHGSTLQNLGAGKAAGSSLPTQNISDLEPHHDTVGRSWEDSVGSRQQLCLDTPSNTPYSSDAFRVKSSEYCRD